MIPTLLSVAPPVADPTGFGLILNRLRAAHNLPPVRYDTGLARWAKVNNTVCLVRGLGHWVFIGGSQIAAWGQTSVQQVFGDWIGSPGHLAAMLSNSTAYGIARGPSVYWTCNFR